MTVKLLQDWYDTETQRQYRGGNLLTKDAATEAGLIALKMADANVTGGTEYQAPAVSRSDTFVVSSAAPANNDGRPDGTVYIQTAA